MSEYVLKRDALRESLIADIDDDNKRQLSRARKRGQLDVVEEILAWTTEKRKVTK